MAIVLVATCFHWFGWNLLDLNVGGGRTRHVNKTKVLELQTVGNIKPWSSVNTKNCAYKNAHGLWFIKSWSFRHRVLCLVRGCWPLKLTVFRELLEVLSKWVSQRFGNFGYGRCTSFGTIWKMYQFWPELQLWPMEFKRRSTYFPYFTDWEFSELMKFEEPNDFSKFRDSSKTAQWFLKLPQNFWAVNTVSSHEIKLFQGVKKLWEF